MKHIIALLVCILSLSTFANEREYIWPKNKMPNKQPKQIAAMTDETCKKDFNADKYRNPYIEWFDAPGKCNGGCMVLISGGAYESCCDVALVKTWKETFTALGFQCVNLVYRTPRPDSIPIYLTAWEDGQRAIRLIKSEAKKRGFNPDKIGTISMSAGSHLAVLLATSSKTKSYEPIDKLDTIPCNINWAIVNAPAYVTTDGETGTPSSEQGYGPDVHLSSIFKFDEKTCPMSLHHGGQDVYSPCGSTLIYRELRKRNIPADLHIYPDKGHGAFGLERGIEFLYQMGIIEPLQPEENILKRFDSDSSRASCIKEDIWPEGKTPNYQAHQCTPYIEWHFPKELKTTSIQIIYSGGSYEANDPMGHEVAPARRYLNSKGMTVVTLKYRTPRPKGLSKHLTAWQDLQRAIKIVRSKAASYGLNPDKIGIMGGSAGGHLTVMGCTSSLHQSYNPIDNIDRISCSVQWGIANYTAYGLTDGINGPNSEGGKFDNDILVPEFSFDLKTCPVLFMHGDKDGYAAMNSVKCWEKMRSIGIQSELHIFATKDHCFHFDASPKTGAYNYLDRIWDFLQQKGVIER